MRRTWTIGWCASATMTGFHDGEDGYRFVYDDERTPYAMQHEYGAVAYLYPDQVGSLRVVADQSGNVIKEILYDPFTSRWTSPDPIGDKGGDPDWYGYCLGDPVNANDPLGLFAGVLAPFIRQAAEGTADFARNYCDMKEANTIGADKYFHCKANYEASKRGLGGKAAAWGLSELRELYGQMKGDPKSDKEADQQANRHGRNASHLTSCGEACDEYRPPALHKRW